MNWTPEQRDAIETDQPELLISAAAGSGKTAVLVARVLRMLRQGGDITRMLIVTFTRAAAAEMRERISDALEKEPGDPHLYRQQQRMNRAKISTLHTFCQGVIRSSDEMERLVLLVAGDEIVTGDLIARHIEYVEFVVPEFFEKCKRVLRVEDDFDQRILFMESEKLAGYPSR